jgi:hypothetical protein
MEIIVQKSKHKVDIHDPEHTDPSWRSAFEAGQRRIKEGKLKFADREEEESYWKAVNSNPGNVPGLSPFFPRLPRIQEMVVLSDNGDLTDEDKVRRFIERASRSKDVDLFCTVCSKISSHAISRSDCFCHKCGTRRKERLL